jgi:hypothetical protein
MKKIALILGLVFLSIGSSFSQLSCGDSFFDSGGIGADYSDNDSTSIVICPTNPGDIVQLTFTSFDIEDGYDFMTIYNGNSNAAEPIGTYTGFLDLGTIYAENPSGCLTIEFTSDESVIAAGWEATVSCVAAPTCAKPTLVNGINITDLSIDLAWTSNGTEAEWVLEYGLTGFQLGTGIELVTITNPTTINGLTELTSYDFYIRANCGNADTSNYSSVLTLQTAKTPLFCGDNFVDIGGAFADYEVNQNYDVVICPTNPGETVELVFSVFDLEDNWDFLTIYDGNTSAGTLIGEFTGVTSPGTIIAENATGCLTVNFASDESIVSFGWEAMVNCIPAVTCLKPVDLSENSVTDLSATISWTSAGAETEWIIEYGVTGFPLGSGTEMVTAINPTTINGLTELTDYDFYIRANCGNSDTSNYASVLTLQTTMTPLAPFICGNQFTDPGGVNGNYVLNYIDTVVICPTNPGEGVTVTFTSFDLELDWDSLLVYNGNSVFEPFIGAFTGDVSPGTVTSTSNSGCLTFAFYSDDFVTATGWEADITCSTLQNPCNVPTALTASSVTSTAASLSWTAGSELSWELEYGPAGFALGTGTTATVNSNPITISNLTAATNYEFYTRAICGIGNESVVSTAGSFTTLNNVGISENTKNFISVSPNPSSGVYTISNSGAQNLEFSVYDAQGRKVMNNNFNLSAKESLSLDLTSYENGMYFIHFTDESQQKSLPITKF